MTDTSYEVGGATLYQVEDGWIELGSGLPFYFGAEPPQLASMMLVEDIAQSLSRLCRYNGHTKRHYSVAEHCILMADYVDRQGGSALDCLTALHHDDAEYIIGDLPRPVKYKMPQFKELEARLDEAVAIRFGTIWPMPPWLKELDARILVDERDAVMRPSGNEWGTDSLERMNVRFMPIRGRIAWCMRRMWLARHKRYASGMTFNQPLWGTEWP